MTLRYKGFTLIELMLAIAIIGILATAVIAFSINQRDKAKRSNMLTSMTNMMPHFVECYFKPGGKIKGYAKDGNLCDPNTGAQWPDLSGAYGEEKQCTEMEINQTAGTICVTCSEGNFVCKYASESHCVDISGDCP